MILVRFSYVGAVAVADINLVELPTQLCLYTRCYRLSSTRTTILISLSPITTIHSYADYSAVVLWHGSDPSQSDGRRPFLESKVKAGVHYTRDSISIFHYLSA